MSCYLEGELFSSSGFRASTERTMIEQLCATDEDRHLVSGKRHSSLCCRCKTGQRIGKSSYCRTCSKLRYWESKVSQLVNEKEG